MNNETTTATGPTTPENIYKREAYIRPGEEAEFEKLSDRLFTDLLPEGTLEVVFVSEIITATWRLRRCNLVEGHMVDQTLLDPMEDPALEKKQRSVDRARAQAHNIIGRSTAELRKLQTERATRRELEINYAESALVDTQQVSRNIEARSIRDDKWRKRMRKAQEEEFQDMCNAPIVPPARPARKSSEEEPLKEAA